MRRDENILTIYELIHTIRQKVCHVTTEQSVELVQKKIAYFVQSNFAIAVHGCGAKRPQYQAAMNVWIPDAAQLKAFAQSGDISFQHLNSLANYFEVQFDLTDFNPARLFRPDLPATVANVVVAKQHVDNLHMLPNHYILRLDNTLRLFVNQYIAKHGMDELVKELELFIRCHYQCVVANVESIEELDDTLAEMTLQSLTEQQLNDFLTGKVLSYFHVNNLARFFEQPFVFRNIEPGALFAQQYIPSTDQFEAESNIVQIETRMQNCSDLI
ncbi:hypothetical protein C2869_12765 [Saccharobesus litoralis]|uniref:Uncharacterized protein n=1 Tax=Saccharobesus litoralis TaxID=2172099 RepID=A0A2S0VST2_9ALTE|nr:hypothetical protein [Saccharobesus litoralis]AWB67257.1 hypothetical protein C2869_12765 [Saccharobesus litoralis]